MSMYARGMTTREIQAHLEKICGIDASPKLLSRVTDAVTEGARFWLQCHEWRKALLRAGDSIGTDASAWLRVPGSLSRSGLVSDRAHSANLPSIGCG